MFIGKYEIDGKEHFAIYYKCSEGYKAWNDDIYYNSACNLEKLDFKISGKTYQERKDSLIELAKDWQLHFSYLSWSYSELYEIQGWFYENAKRYGLVKIFHENAIC